MNPLFITENDVQQLAPIPDVIQCLDRAFQDQAAGKAFTNSRGRLRMPRGTLHMMSGAIPGYFGYKAYTSAAGGTQFLFFLFAAETAELLSIMQADQLGQIRTGAATGLATRLLANPGASQAALFGAGWQARTQLLAMDSVRDLQQVWIVNRNPERATEFIRAMQPKVKAQLSATRSAEDAIKSSEIVTTMTSSRDPVFKGEWLQPGTHVNAAGGNMLLRREIDNEAMQRFDRMVVDSIDQARIEAGEFVGVIETGRRHWEDFVELRDVAAGSKPGRTSANDVTLFKSLGIALEDVAIGRLVYERALEKGLGRRISLTG